MDAVRAPAGIKYKEVYNMSERTYFDGVPMPTPEEMAQDTADFNAMLKWAQSLTDDQRAALCDFGYYNNTMKGYLIAAARDQGLKLDAIRELLHSLSYMHDTMDKKDADALYTRYYNGELSDD